jgi:YcxB-like protein
MEAITVNFKLSEKEFLDASQLIVNPRATHRIARTTISLSLLTLGTFWYMTAFGFEFLSALVVVGALLPLLIYLYFFQFDFVARRCYRGDRRLREGMTITFTDEHITVQSKLVESKQSWKLYTDVLEGESCYALIYGKDIRMAAMIPKRAFKTRKQHMAFRELIGAQFARTMPVQQVGEIEAAEREYQPASLEPPDWR